ncbi:hypothetical protein DB313_00525 [Borrelia turcica IST7]|uniref:Uncharacterized protein n=1 Tax=Borrelia turcica IST7 TaxID=1104446 RepID=A0A386PLT9_9SPIR|nr:hypothetical protein [Borrelia turcica]AYE35999.1 hypothetical protein DB313_00525 [Borrelia turcica IST7]
MKGKILCTIILLSLSDLMLFSEELKGNLKLSSDVEKELLDIKLNENKEDTSINQSTEIKYPQTQKIYNYDLTTKKDSKKIEKNLSYNKHENAKITANNNIEIRQSSKIQYPKDRVNIREEHSGKNTWYNIKVYPNYNNDNFKKIKTINAINSKMKTKINKNFALIGPILEDNLGKITKTLATKGYSELEYIKIE